MDTNQVSETDTPETGSPAGRVVIRDDKGRIVTGSLNPYGRPRRGKTYRELAANLPEKRKLEVINAQLAKAIKGQDTRAAEFLRDTAEGKPKQEVDVHSAADEWRMLLLDQLVTGGQARVIDGESRLLD